MSGSWTDLQTQQLCSFVSEIPASVSDVERWKLVSKRLGSHSKGECYRKYQELLRAPSAAAVATEKEAVAVTTADDSKVQPRCATTRDTYSPDKLRWFATAPVPGRPPLPEESAFLTSILSDGTRVLPKSWTSQGIALRRDSGFRWALRQWEGGPCGPLAVIQAHIVRCLSEQCGEQWREPSEEQQRRSVLAAMAHIILQSSSRSSNGEVVICSSPERGNGGGAVLGGHLSARHLFHCMSVQRIPLAHGRDFLVSQLAQHYHEYTAERGPGLLLFLGSVLLSRGQATIKAEMVLESHLVDRHGYAGHELVNLLIAGQATSCVFDELGDDGEAHALVTEQGQLCGIRSKCDVGFLTVMEYFDYVKVGERLKSPAAPVWVICMDSHYTLAFVPPSARLDRHEDESAGFDLAYYDQLEKNAQLLVLTLTPTGSRLNSLDPHQSPPLELVLYTRWPSHKVDWNGADPLL